MLAQLFQENGLEAVMLGNAGAALQGAPVTTVDVDFMFRPTRVNVNKLKKIAKALDATIFRPFYPISGLYRLSRESDLLQVDFMVRADGVRSFEGLRARSSRFDFDGASLLVASLEDIIKSKEAAGRPRDLAVMYVLKEAAQQKANRTKRAVGRPAPSE
ncbi:MAG: hypothetical protein NTZ56_06705 [Acidobacteria bacterium]|nr:hypothetical protein [Acidobacteriota bacterium]